VINKIIKCTNCGKIENRNHVLPLCDNCFEGLQDYESFIANLTDDVEINIVKKTKNKDNFLQV